MLAFCRPPEYGAFAETIDTTEHYSDRQQQITCNECGSGNPLRSKFCCECGAPIISSSKLSEMMPFHSAALGYHSVVDDSEPPPLPGGDILQPFDKVQLLWTPDGIERLKSNDLLYTLMESPEPGHSVTLAHQLTMRDLVDSDVDDLLANGVVEEVLIIPALQDDQDYRDQQEEEVLDQQGGDEEVIQTEIEIVEFVPVVVDVVFWDKGRTFPIQFTRRPLGFKWRMNPPVKICQVVEGSHADELGVKKEWVVKSVNGVDCSGQSYKFTTDLMTASFNKLRWVEFKPPPAAAKKK